MFAYLIHLFQDENATKPKKPRAKPKIQEGIDMNQLANANQVIQYTTIWTRFNNIIHGLFLKILLIIY